MKFADDGTLWRTVGAIQKMVREMELDLEEIRRWVKKWRMKLNVIKTEYCVFSKDRSMLDLNAEIKMDNTILKRTRKPKLLGVTLDEKLTFQDHVKLWK